LRPRLTEVGAEAASAIACRRLLQPLPVIRVSLGRRDDFLQELINCMSGFDE
jgi:hypothetical protein